MTKNTWLEEATHAHIERIFKVFIKTYPELLGPVEKGYSELSDTRSISCATEPLKIKQKVIINTYGHGPWHNATGFVVEALGNGMYKISVTNLGTTRVLSFHRSELTEVTT